MKALTLWQPWASLIAACAKTIETRSWQTSYRGALAIHASARTKVLQSGEITADASRAACSIVGPFNALPRGAIIAICDLVECVPVEDLWPELATMGDEQWFGDYSQGRFAWILSDIRVLNPPVSMKGALGLWEWKEPEMA